MKNNYIACPGHKRAGIQNDCNECQLNLRKYKGLGTNVMNIQDAIKTGLPFKRPSWMTWVEPRFTAIFHRIPGGRGGRMIMKFASKEDLIATDWIVKENAYGDLEDAIKDLCKKAGLEMRRVNVRAGRRDPNFVVLGGHGKVRIKATPACRCRSCRNERTK